MGFGLFGFSFVSKGTNGIWSDPIGSYEQGTVEKQGGVGKTNTPALKCKDKLNVSERKRNNYRKG